jgi:hypothetical protein
MTMWLWLWLGCGEQSVTSHTNPLLQMKQTDRTPFQVTVLEVLPARGYTYLHVQGEREPDGVWVASLALDIAPGAQAEIRAIGEAQGFQSRLLDRTFDRLLFAVVRER